MTLTEIRRLESCEKLRGRTITQSEAAMQLALSERQVRRLYARFKAEGEGGVRSRRRGRPSNRRLPADLIDTALELVATRYADFGPTFANEKLREAHGLHLSTERLRQAMIAAQLWQPKRPRRRAVHPPRERRPQFGELVQVDGSPHAWFEDRAPKCTLLVFIDDATSALVGLRFVKSESTWNYLLLMREYMAHYGRPLAIYSDRHTIFRSPQALTTSGHTQVGRALAELDVELLCASTPQAKGRVERANQTLQRRLVRELRLRDISTLADANAFLTSYRSDHNARFAVAPRSAADAHRSNDGLDLDQSLSVRYQRVLSKNHTFQIGRAVYAIDCRPRSRHITIIEHHDGTFDISAGHQKLRYRKVRDVPQAPIIDAKQLAEPYNHRQPNPKKAHTPPPSHPWKQEGERRLRRLAHADISTWGGPDIIGWG